MKEQEESNVLVDQIERDPLLLLELYHHQEEILQIQLQLLLLPLFKYFGD
jgi:hypothetical protein